MLELIFVSFSVALVYAVRFKQASKKFGGDEKQPKLRLVCVVD